MIKANLFLVLFVCLANNVAADCMTDRFGEVYCGRGKCVKDKEGKVFCSKYQFGDAIINKYGKAVCGKGRCLTGSDFNNYVCSIAEGGGAEMNNLGVVKCYRGCEKASSEMCESDKGK